MVAPTLRRGAQKAARTAANKAVLTPPTKPVLPQGGIRPPPPPPTPPATGFAAWPRWKRIAVTFSFAGVIISGTIWGAGMKMRQEAKAERKKALEATVDEKVAILEERRKYLEVQKGEVQKKLDDLHGRMKARESGHTSR